MRPEEALKKSYIRERWKGYLEFMFWGSFTYNSIGPCHIWQPEIAVQKKVTKEEISQLNSELEPLAKAKWELNTGLERLGLRSRPGRKPVWKFTKATGKLSRSQKGGIDWYRYRKEILLERLFPFIRQIRANQGIEPVVMEDKAPSHSHLFNQQTYSL
jgi:hypothetical protein